MLEQTEHKFNYNWTLKNANFTKDKGTVFSCFACGGGSSMGYKLAGFDVVGCNEIDKRVMDLYEKNHHPRYAFLEPIQTFKERTAFPDALYNLDILDGSPPCSTFTIAMARTRQETWGKEKRFREGQTEQVLDTLFFDFIDVVRKLRPKVVIAENVKGLLQGAAKKYVQRIHMEFEDAGYTCQHFLLDAQYMGVPQHRERVFFVCLRNDLIQYVPTAHTLFDTYPLINLNFDEKPITCEDAHLTLGDPITTPCYIDEYKRLKKLSQIGLQYITMTYSSDDALPQCWIDNKRVPVEDVASNDGLSVDDFVDYFFGKCGCKSNVFEGVIIHFTDFRY